MCNASPQAHTETMSLLPVLLLLLSVCQRSQPVQGLTAVSRFSQNGLSGSITFNQPTPSSSTTITLNITQLPLDNLPWHVHVFPFRLGSPSPCSSSSVAGHFDPLLASRETDYSARCAGNSSLCEMGDLSGKHGRLTSLNSMQHILWLYFAPAWCVQHHRTICGHTQTRQHSIGVCKHWLSWCYRIWTSSTHRQVTNDWCWWCLHSAMDSPNMTTVYTDLLLSQQFPPHLLRTTLARAHRSSTGPVRSRTISVDGRHIWRVLLNVDITRYIWPERCVEDVPCDQSCNIRIVNVCTRQSSVALVCVWLDRSSYDAVHTMQVQSRLFENWLHDCLWRC